MVKGIPKSGSRANLSTSRRDGARLPAPDVGDTSAGFGFKPASFSRLPTYIEEPTRFQEGATAISLAALRMPVSLRLPQRARATAKR